MIDAIIRKIWSKRINRHGYKIVKVKGWRTFLVDAPAGSRQTVTFLFGK